MVDVKICCKIWGISLVSMAMKDRPAGSVLCSLRSRMRDKTQLTPQIIFPTTRQDSSHCCHHAIKGLGKQQREKFWQQVGHRVPFSNTNKSVSRDFYPCPLSNMPELHFDQDTSDSMRHHHNWFAEDSYRFTLEIKILILNWPPWTHSFFSSPVQWFQLCSLYFFFDITADYT